MKLALITLDGVSKMAHATRAKGKSLLEMDCGVT